MHLFKAFGLVFYFDKTLFASYNWLLYNLIKKIMSLLNNLLPEIVWLGY